MHHSTQNYGKVAVVLHWLIAVVVIGMVWFGLYISENEAYHLMPTHKSIGILIFIFVVWRLILRLIKGFLRPISHLNPVQKILSTLVHWILLLGSVLFPLSGMIMSTMGGRGLQVFGVEVVARNEVNGRPTAINDAIAEMAANVHEMLVPVMIGAIVLHIAGVIYHQFIIKDGTLSRMLGCTKCLK